VLGPILFVIYINDLPDNLKSECYMFADDTKVFKDVNDIEDNKILHNDKQTLMRHFIEGLHKVKVDTI
jgi:hypothetical protein